MSESVAIVGGGITGLALGWRLMREGHDVVVLEASKRPGGVVSTVKRQGLVIEQGPQSLQANAHEAIDVIDELGLRDQILEASPDSSGRYLLWHGQLEALPKGPTELLQSPLLRVRAAARAAIEPLVRKAAEPDPEESVHEFLSRRVGTEIAERFADPMVAGIFGGDATALEVASAFPDWVAAERDHGSLILGAMRSRRRDRPDWVPRRMFTLRGGLQQLPEKLAEELGDRLHLQDPVVKVEAEGAGWKVRSAKESFEVERVVVACPAGPAGRLLPDLRGVLGELERAPIAAIHLAWREADVPDPPSGFGWLCPSSERTDVLGCLYVSSTFPEHTPGHVMLRVMVGGARDPDRVRLPDDDLIAHARAVVAETMGIEADPALWHVMSHRQGIPQYNRGHAQRLAQLQSAKPGLSFLGWNYTGIGLRHTFRAAAEWSA